MSGSNGSLENLYLQHKNRLFTIAMAMLGERGLAEDALHDVFAAAARNPDTLLSARSPLGYLAVSVKNRALSSIRKQGRRRSALRAAGGTLAETRPSSGPAGRAQTSELLDLVKDLPGELREVVALRIWGDMGFREIAAATGSSKSTAHKQYTRALEMLRRRLVEE